jgi:hypothetical protein
MSWLQNGNEVLLTSPTSMTEITGLRNTRYNFIFNLIIANPGATVSINATINNRSLSNAYSYKTVTNNGTIFDEEEQNDATFSVGTTTPGFSMNLLYSETNQPKAGITYKVGNGGGDQTTAPTRTVTYWNSSLMSAMTALNFDNSNIGAYGIGFNTIMISAN